MSSPSSADPAGVGEGPPRRVALLGSTGSIGRQAVEVLADAPGRLPRDRSRDRFEPGAPRRADGPVPTRGGRPRRRGEPAGRPAGHRPGRRAGRARGARDARRRRPRHRRHRRRRQPPTGPRRAACRQGRRDRQQGDPRRRGPPRHAPRARPCRGHRDDRRDRPIREPARLAPPHRLRAFGHLAVSRRRIDGGRREPSPDRVGRSVPRRDSRRDGRR